jgi:hypothetical protein
LCWHSIKVLDREDIKSIPSKYIIKYWIRDVKNDTVRDREGIMITEDAILDVRNHNGDDSWDKYQHALRQPTTMNKSYLWSRDYVHFERNMRINMKNQLKRADVAKPTQPFYPSKFSSPNEEGQW